MFLCASLEPNALYVCKSDDHTHREVGFNRSLLSAANHKTENVHTYTLPAARLAGSPSHSHSLSLSVSVSLSLPLARALSLSLSVSLPHALSLSPSLSRSLSLSLFLLQVEELDHRNAYHCVACQQVVIPRIYNSHHTTLARAQARAPAHTHSTYVHTHTHTHTHSHAHVCTRTHARMICTNS